MASPSTAEAEALAISIPRSDAHVIRQFEMPYGLFVPEVPSEKAKPDARHASLPLIWGRDAVWHPALSHQCPSPKGALCLELRT